MTLLTEREPQTVPAGRQVPAPSRLPLAVGALVVLSVALRLYSPSALWLDEALSVNIARLPLDQIPAALRQDGSPPLYYVLLHGWMAVFGTGDLAVRALSSLFGLAALPAAFELGRRLRDEATGWVAVLLLGTAPIAVRYSTETRMYSLLTLLALLGAIALHAALDQPDRRHLAAVGLLSGLLLLTHYWSLYLLAATGLLLVWLSLRGPRPAAARRSLLALCAGGLLFLPWLPTFLFQLGHTGAPWAAPVGASALLATLQFWAGGGTLQAGVLTLVVLALVGLAVVGHRREGGVWLGRPVHGTAVALAAVAFGALVLGIGQAVVGHVGFSPRYSSPVVGLALVAAALGVAMLPPRARIAVTAFAVGCGLMGSVAIPFNARRTEAAQIAAALQGRVHPGDLVVYCPDQLGPAVSRLLPADVHQVVYPTFAPPQRIDWINYAARNRAASPVAFAQRALAQTPGTIWLVFAAHYATFGNSCTDLSQLLLVHRGTQLLDVGASGNNGEQMSLLSYP